MLCRVAFSVLYSTPGPLGRIFSIPGTRVFSIPGPVTVTVLVLLVFVRGCKARERVARAPPR